MEESQELAHASSVVRAVAPGLFASVGALIRGGQDRGNLELDRAIVREMLQIGPPNFRYRGLAMEYETFADAHQEEIERLVSNTINAMSKAESIVDESKVNPDQLNPEFRHRWLLEVSNVSDETLQDLWARLLAGELESPGSVSNDTMSIARDLNKERAGEFQTLCSAALCSLAGTPLIVVGCGNPGANSLRPFGLGYDVLMRLAHHRLIINDMTSYREFPRIPVPPGIPVRLAESTWLLDRPGEIDPNDALRRIQGILFTPAGEELFAVVQKTSNPSYTAAMLKTLEQDGWTAIPRPNST